MRHGIPAALLILAFVACDPNAISTTPSPTPSPTTTATFPAELQQQLDETSAHNLASARNILNQASLIENRLSIRLTGLTIDHQTFQDINQELQPKLVQVANILSGISESSDEKESLLTDFREIYFNILTGMFSVMNNSLGQYQTYFEVPISTNINPPDSTFTDRAMQDLAVNFDATEITEHYLAELGQYNTLLPKEDTQKSLNGLKSMQTNIINGVINFTNQGASQELQQQAYQTIVQSLTNPNLLLRLKELAIAVFGDENVAFTQNEVTPNQPNPNQIIMVVRETETEYRQLRIENNQLINQRVTDSRGLSASDYLQKTNVVKVENPS